MSFDVMEDFRLAPDPVRFARVRSGDCTPFAYSMSLYVANPQGAGDQEFDVEVRARSSG